ncbi:MAG: peptidoglycan DD-metalloendopeptidase family protein [Renibacterium salmoninarum]|jgi:murein DD-endopeptidase MepM/ murein hydrolase activator NlpD|uniref:transglycosylase SLT domain-containing protein n=1 Tax=Bacillati TaxID=1783272 RepID=UPI00264B6C43|nr:peptidoglycan DD-metalloendopeptidase family protein [Renibacterium salmoninarum]
MKSLRSLLLLPFLMVLGLVGLALVVAPGSATASPCQVVQVDKPGPGGAAVVQVPNGWGPLVEEAAKFSGVPASVLAKQIEAESGWNPTAVSPAGARGLTQFMPATWAMYGQGDPFEPRAAITALGKYMKALIDQLAPLAQSTGKDPVALALAGYNAGPGAVQAANGIPAFKETQDYVAKILNGAQSSYSATCTPAVGGTTVGKLEGKWVDPIPGAGLISPYGPRSLDGFHYGADLSTGGGAQIVAPADMLITKATDVDAGTGAGTHIKAQTLDKVLTLAFYHMAAGSLRVKVGDTVAAGTPIGIEGATGNVTGAHLHFEIFPGTQKPDPWPPGDKTIDPIAVLTEQGVRR